MALTIALFEKIGSLSVLIILGFIAVRFGIMKFEDSKVLSAWALYFLTPCAMLDAFQYEFTAEKLTGMGIALLGSLIVVAVFGVLTQLLKKSLRLSPVDTTSLEYPNAGNFMLPLIASAMGGDWVIYCSSCFMVMNVFMFSHGKAVLSGEKGIHIDMFPKNVVLLAIIAGFIMFVLNVQIPGPLGTAVSTMGDMMGPAYMFTIGMIIGNADLKAVFGNKRAWLICLGRLVVYPLVVIVVLRVCGVLNIHPNASRIMLIVVLTAGAPAAVMVTQFSQLYRSVEETEFASVVNILSTVLCLGTMPCIAYLYQKLIF